MISFAYVQVPSSKTLVPSTLFSLPSKRSAFPYLPAKPSKGLARIRAASGNPSEKPLSAPSEGKNPLSQVIDVPRSILRKTLQPLGNFGFGRRSIWDGGVGLFMVSGAALLALTMVWLKGIHFSSRFRKYQAVFEFSQACGICLGTPVRIRGVTVGRIVQVNSSLKSIDAVVEVEDDKIIIPRNSLVEVNQSGLLMETLIDITPRHPLPSPSASPLDQNCVKEGLILCDRERIRVQQGVSLDALVGIFTRIGREMEEIGVSRSYRLAEKVATIIQEAQPLIAKIEAMVEDVQPLLLEVRDSSLLKDIESLTKSLAESTADMRKVQSSISTPENADLIRKSMSTLISTLKNLESISSDVSGFTGDEVTKRNLKLLIRSLSRLL